MAKRDGERRVFEREMPRVSQGIPIIEPFCIQKRGKESEEYWDWEKL